MPPPSLRMLSIVFGRIGLLSFGGPAAQIALMHRELVETRNWIDEKTYLRALSLCMLLPGPEAMQLATYAGWRLRGTVGGLIAGGLFVLPGAIVIAILASLYVIYGQLPWVQSAFLGIKAAVIVIVIKALQGVATKALTRKDAWVIAFLSFVGIFFLNLPFPALIIAAAIWGYATSTAVVEDVTSSSALPAFPWTMVCFWLCLWLAPLVALSLTGQELLSDLGWFFAKLAVVTFGGAYAVLAYMTQTAVEHYGWLTTNQMIDALGLAETTPGPLILVTQFVAMVSAQNQGGTLLPFAAGAVALWATFVPCFLWIFLTGPYLTYLSSKPRLSSALQAITAAVVGVILNLSVWFGLHVLFADVTTNQLGPFSMPWPEIASFDWRALVLTITAAVLLLRFKLGLFAVLPLMAAAGVLVTSV